MPETSCTKLKDLYKYIGLVDEGIPDLAIGELVCPNAVFCACV